MRTIIALCGVAFSLAVAGCPDLPYGTSTITIANKSSYNLRMVDTSNYSSYLNKEEIKQEERIIKKNQTISFEMRDEGIAPDPPKIITVAFYNSDTNTLIKEFKKDHNESRLKYVLTKEEGEPHYQHKKWYLLEITDKMLQ